MSRNQRLNASITIGAVLEGSVRKNIGFLKSGLASIGGAIKDVERRQRELQKQRRTLEKEGKSVEALDREYEELERTLGRLKRAQERWNRAAQASRRVGSTFSAMTSDIGRQARRLAVGVAAAGTAIVGLAASTASLGDEVAKTADKLGFSIGGLQELRYAAERSGVSVSTFDSSMVAFTKRLGEAANGSGAAVKGLEALGLEAADLVDLAPEEALGVVAERLGSIEAPAEQAAVAAALFSRAGVGMVNMLRGGSDGLAQLRDDARHTGYVLSDKAARDAEVFQDKLLDLQLVGKGLKNTIGAEMMPVVSRAMAGLSGWLVTNRDDVRAWAESFAEGTEAALPRIMEFAGGMREVGGAIGRVVGQTAELVGGWGNLGLVMGVVLGAGTIVKIARFAGALFGLGRAMIGLVGTLPLVAGGIKGIGLALTANPIGLVIAGIAAGAYLIWQNWEPITGWFSGLWSELRETFSGFADFVGGVFSGDMERAADGVSSAWAGMSSTVVRWVGLLAWPLKRVFDGVIKPVMDALGLTAPIADAWESVKGAVGGAIEWVGDQFSTAWGKIEPVIDGLLSGEAIGNAWSTVKEKLGGVLTWLGEKFGWLGGIVSPVVDALRWVRDKGAAVVPGAGNSDGPSGSSRRGDRVQERAIGGHYGPGWLLRHEKGPELTYENRAGWVADARATRRLAAYADRVAGVMGSGVLQPALAAASGATHNHFYTVNASGVSADEVIARLDRRARLASSAALYDRVPETGFFGR